MTLTGFDSLDGKIICPSMMYHNISFSVFRTLKEKEEFKQYASFFSLLRDFICCNPDQRISSPKVLEKCDMLLKYCYYYQYRNKKWIFFVEENY